MPRILLLLLVVAGTLAAQDAPLFVEQKADVTVSGLDITLGDLCVFEGANAAKARILSIGTRPQSGRALVVARDTVVRILAEGGIASKSLVISGAESTRVDVKTVTFRGDDIRRLGQDHLRTALGEHAVSAKFGRSATPPDLTVCAGRWSTRLAIRDTTEKKSPVGAVTLEAVAIVDGVERERLSFVVDVRRRAKVAVAARELSMGATLRADDIAFEEREVTADTTDVVLPDGVPVGATVTRRIAAGTSLIARDFRARPVIERGDTVTVRFRNGPLSVTGVGRAQGAGAPGDRIAVINAESNKVVYGTVVDSRTVDVAPAAPAPTSGDLR